MAKNVLNFYGTEYHLPVVDPGTKCTYKYWDKLESKNGAKRMMEKYKMNMPYSLKTRASTIAQK